MPFDRYAVLVANSIRSAFEMCRDDPVTYWVRSCVLVAPNIEADALIGIPNRGMILVEVKGYNEVREINGRYEKRDRNPSSPDGLWPNDTEGWKNATNPYDQVNEIMYRLRHYVDRSESLQLVPVAQCVVLARIDRTAHNPNLYENRTIFRNEVFPHGEGSPHSEESAKRLRTQLIELFPRNLSNPHPEKHFGHFFSFPNDGNDRLKKLGSRFRTDHTVVKGNYLEDARDRIDQFASQIHQSAANVMATSIGTVRSDGALIFGPAGTGKTYSAIELARLLASGAAQDLGNTPVLLLCYSERLARHLSDVMTGQKLGHRVRVAVPEWLADRQVGPDRSDLNTAAFWEGELVTKELERHEHVIVDEAQDFTREALSALRNACFTLSMCVDTRQMTRLAAKDPSVDLEEYREIISSKGNYFDCELDGNIRNAKLIYDHITKVLLDVWSQSMVDDHGEWAVHGFSDIEQLKKKLKKAMKEMSNGLSDAKILVTHITEQEEQTITTCLQKAAETPFERTAIPVEAFKGMETDGAILIIGSAAILPGGTFEDELYVGLTRATTSLTVIAPTEMADRLIGNASDGTPNDVRPETERNVEMD